MTNFEIRGLIPPGSGPLTRLMAPEYSGSVSDPLKTEFVFAAKRTAETVEGIRTDLQAIGWGVDVVGSALESLRDQVLPRFDRQLRIMGEQLDVLRSIDRSLRDPRQTAATERIGQASLLLEEKDFSWALRYAREAIDHDATNPGGFAVAALASIAMGQRREAVDYLVAATNKKRLQSQYGPWISALRQLARVQMEIGGQELPYARSNLNIAIEWATKKYDSQKARENPKVRKNVKDSEALKAYRMDLATLYYEASIAAVLDNDEQSASQHIEAATLLDQRFAQLALGEPLFAGHEAVPAHALSLVRGQIEKERVAKEEATRKRQEETARQAELAPLYKKRDSYVKILEKIHPWDVQHPPTWLYRADHRGWQDVHYNNAMKSLRAFRIEAADRRRSLEELEPILDQALDEINRMAKVWSRYKMPYIFDKTTRGQMSTIKAQAELWLEKQTKESEK